MWAKSPGHGTITAFPNDNANSTEPDDVVTFLKGKRLIPEAPAARNVATGPGALGRTYGEHPGWRVCHGRFPAHSSNSNAASRTRRHVRSIWLTRAGPTSSISRSAATARAGVGNKGPFTWECGLSRHPLQRYRRPATAEVSGARFLQVGLAAVRQVAPRHGVRLGTWATDCPGTSATEFLFRSCP